jgi:hypothetical protein
VDAREECHWSHACSLQASWRGPMASSSVNFCRKTRTVHTVRVRRECQSKRNQ